ncbi:MAG: MFS transporter [Chlamydiales bacterium]|nr:MFS transporter [Chlamydiales bacterium]
MRIRGIITVYLSALIQGVVLVVFPAISSIFTSAQGFQLSSAAYGSLFIPQAIISIIFSLWSTTLIRKVTIKKVFLIGLIANLVAMGLLTFSCLVMKNNHISYVVLLLATASLGLGFGLTVPCVNTFATLFFPKKIDAALLFLNALLGLGTAMAPIFFLLFVGMGFWWGLPLLLGTLIVVLILCSYCLSLTSDAGDKTTTYKLSKLPKQFWIFAAFALVYGIIETVNGNWVVVYMSKNVKETAFIASLSLTSFWAMVTIGRVFFALIEKLLPEKRVFQLLPFIAAIGFVFISLLPLHSKHLGIIAFGLVGFGCSALLPLIISFTSQSFGYISKTLSGIIIAFYMMGYGLGAFGVGSLQDMLGLSLKAIFGMSVGISIILGFLSFAIIKVQQTLSK